MRHQRRPSLSVFAVVTNVMSIPDGLDLVGWISGNTLCSGVSCSCRGRRLGRQAAEVLMRGIARRDEPVEELPHPRAAQLDPDQVNPRAAKPDTAPRVYGSAVAAR
jgi:hypothetical protein